MSDVIFMNGARGGAGLTTCAVKLGIALSEAGERTLIVDGDTECASGLQISGLQGLNVYTLADVETGACRVKQAILQHPSSPNLYVLPSLGCTDGGCAERAVAECEPLFDYVICDSIARSACRRALLVSDPYHSSLAGAKKRGGELKDAGFKDVGLLINKVNGGLVFDGAILTPQEFATVVRLPLWGVIPEDLSLPLNKMRSGTKKAFALTAALISGKGKKTYGVVREYLGVKGIIKRKMRERV
ncbi:MAG: AAA family ATPase [Clostridia bacterium]|nr:AAA family ATPase [Clostridia bacterium]